MQRGQECMRQQGLPSGQRVPGSRVYRFERNVVALRLDPALQGRVDASDVLQETYIVVSKRITDFLQRRPTSFKLWLRGEAMQQIGMQRRSAPRFPFRAESAQSDPGAII